MIEESNAVESPASHSHASAAQGQLENEDVRQVAAARIEVAAKTSEEKSNAPTVSTNGLAQRIPRRKLTVTRSSTVMSSAGEVLSESVP